jgi:polysaccharide export outer membrane protein
MTVLDLVLLAGGPNQFASANKAKLYRKVGGELKVYPIKLDDLINDGEVETNYSLQPSDIVTVPERSF